VAWSEKWAVRFGQNKTRHGLHFESAAAYLGLLEDAGFIQSRTLLEAGLGSNAMLVATKPAG
jgi:hypothetical protein